MFKPRWNYEIFCYVHNWSNASWDCFGRVIVLLVCFSWVGFCLATYVGHGESAGGLIWIVGHVNLLATLHKNLLETQKSPGAKIEGLPWIAKLDYVPQEFA